MMVKMGYWQFEISPCGRDDKGRGRGEVVKWGMVEMTKPWS
jgi:hypothetical protein